MKLETVIVITKGACFTIIGFTAPIAAGITQYGADEWPTKMTWTAMGIAAVAGGATQLLSFLSGSYTEYAKGRKTDNGTTPPPPTP